MIIKYCHQCRQRINDDDLLSGKAVIYNNASYCAACSQALEKQLRAVGSVKGSGPTTPAKASRPSTPAKAATHPQVRTRRKRRRHEVARSRQTVGSTWFLASMVLLILCLSVAIYLLLKQRPTPSTSSKRMPSLMVPSIVIPSHNRRSFHVDSSTAWETPTPKDELANLKIDLKALCALRLYQQAQRRLQHWQGPRDRSLQELSTKIKQALSLYDNPALPLFCDFSTRKANLCVHVLRCRISNKEANFYHLKFVYNYVSTLRAYFSLKQPYSKILLKITHKGSSMGKSSGYSPITITINGYPLVKDKSYPPHLRTEQWEITPYCHPRGNILLWRLGKAKTHYWLQSFEIFAP